MRKAELIEALQAQALLLKRKAKKARRALRKAKEEGKANTKAFSGRVKAWVEEMQARAQTQEELDVALEWLQATGERLGEAERERDVLRAELDRLRDHHRPLKCPVGQCVNAPATGDKMCAEHREKLTTHRERQQPPAGEAAPRCMVRGCEEPRSVHRMRPGARIIYRPLCAGHEARESEATNRGEQNWWWCSRGACLRPRPTNMGERYCGQHGGRDLSPEDLAPLEEGGSNE